MRPAQGSSEAFCAGLKRLAAADEQEQLLAHGATGLIVKPFDPMTLPQDIRPCWEHGRGARSG